MTKAELAYRENVDETNRERDELILQQLPQVHYIARRIFERHALIGPDANYDQIRVGVERALAMEETPLSSPYSAQPSAERGAGAPMARRSAIYPPAPHTPSAASTMERSELSRRYSEFHALIVQTAKHFCVKAAPRCEGCPLRPLLPPERRSR